MEAYTEQNLLVPLFFLASESSSWEHQDPCRLSRGKSTVNAKELLLIHVTRRLGTKGIATRSKDATRGSWPY